MNNKQYFLQGFILPTTLVLTFMSFWIVSGYLWWLDDKINELEYKIAVTKASYNAESGVADFVYPFLISSTFTKDTLYKPESQGGDMLNQNLSSSSFSGYDVSMGSYDAGSSNWGYDESSGDSIRQNFIFDQSSSSGTGKIRGVAYWGPLKSDGTCCKSKVTRTSSLSGNFSGWGRYMYFTASEKAGGAPFSHDTNPTLRRDVKFWYQDVINGVIQTNGDLVFSDFSSGSPACPDFSDATWYFTPGHTGASDWGNCSASSGYSTQYEALFRADTDEDVDTLTTCKYQYPPNMLRTYNEAQYIIPADYMLHASNGTGLKDTLVMTEIEFLPNGAAQVYQWWYLMPPHLKKYKGNQTTDGNDQDETEITDVDIIHPKPHHVNGFNELYQDIMGPGSNWREYDYWDDKADDFTVLDQICDVNFFPNGDIMDVDIRTCKHYLDSLRAYHSRYVNTSSLLESYMEGTASGKHGIAGHHFDFHNGINQDGSGALDPDLLVYQEYISYNQPAVIYVKGGPVRVKGTYQGQWTVLTDSETTYYRHALNDSVWTNSVPDTISNNIYIIDDLVNVDANAYGSMQAVQPDESCNGGSDNIMGLLSGANIIVASTRKNGLGNGCNNTNPTIYNCNSNISSVKINAALMALDESFVVQYWQNTTGDPISTNQYAPNYLLGSTAQFYNYDFQWWDEDDDFVRRTDMPPWADARGDIKQNTAGNNDYRGVIVLWGGVVQRYRGYVYRNPTGSYDGASVGYPSKDYNYDNNILCHEPPGWPPLQCEGDSEELDIKITGSITGKN